MTLFISSEVEYSQPFFSGKEDGYANIELDLTKVKAPTMKKPFEAIAILDQKVKHEVRGGLVRINKHHDGERGMHLMFVRRPVLDGWENFGSLESRIEIGELFCI